MALISVEHAGVDRLSSPDSLNVIHTERINSTIIDLYSVGDMDKVWETLEQREMPFIYWLLIHGPKGEKVRVRALFDGGAMVGAMCALFFKEIQHRLCGQTKPSERHLQMANGIIVPSQGVWKGRLELGGLQSEGEFEVFDSGGSWEFLFGKPLLCCFNAMHDFNTDTVTIQMAQGSVKLGNSSEFMKQTSTGTHLTHNVEQQRNLVGGSSSMNPPLRQVLHMDVSDSLVQDDKSSSILDHISNTPEGTKSDVNKANEYVTWTTTHCEGKNREQDERAQGEMLGTIQGGGSIPPSREVLNDTPAPEEMKETDNFCPTVSKCENDAP